jgi:DNA-binding PadR family transcriptional regulator
VRIATLAESSQPIEVQRLYSGLIRLHVLHHAQQEPIFGFGIMQELRRHGYHIGPGTIYPMLHAMEKSGLLRSKTLKKEGRMQRAYRATPAGRRALLEAKGKVQELFHELFEEE